MKLKIFQVDAFTSKVFGGNPAAVIPLENWLDDKILQNIGLENNLSETAFFVKEKEGYRIRWFTPTSEVDLCGHATLASSFVLFNILNKKENVIKFNSRSGELLVEKNDDLISLNFPARNPQKIETPENLLATLTERPSEILFDKSIICVFENEDIVRNLKPKVKDFLNVNTHGVIITAPGENVDFVSRFFAPDVGIDEDPVTGYAHTLLIPYWAKRLAKDKLHALQVSQRGGELFCENLNGRVKISGNAVLYLEGEITI
ncbi:MAG: PhzF family phenazine biosynthesis protein [Ignavibacteriae bacterium]|nr:PhzF family phenazine biosynthesis protein [Ignavibacteriota bacterium]MCB9208038.1 PhzF family phenazine biosynthesis protein [Ignavibacteriales bacterium]MCB9258807.1 PhzF family phenazine biosynthesis protein [Ignavibacteriales bacterium]